MLKCLTKINLIEFKQSNSSYGQTQRNKVDTEKNIDKNKTVKRAKEIAIVIEVFRFHETTV